MTATLILTLLMVGAYKSPTVHRGQYSTPDAGPLGMLGFSIFMMIISLPSVVITYRYVDFMPLFWIVNLT